MKGKLFVIESGTDASGKATQTEKLFQRLKNEGYGVHMVEYPNYKSDSSALVKMYLNGDFGNEPGDVNSYTASTFYAVDRYASYRKEWQAVYEQGEIIIADRYTTSNMVHQASKIKKRRERETFLRWLRDLEFVKFGLPQPDLVIFLDMPPEQSALLMKQRQGRIKDIHEMDRKYLAETYENAVWVARECGWTRIDCLIKGKLRSIEEIHEEIYEKVKSYLDVQIGTLDKKGE